MTRRDREGQVGSVSVCQIELRAPEVTVDNRDAPGPPPGHGPALSAPSVCALVRVSTRTRDLSAT